MEFPGNVDKDSMMKQAQNIWTMLDEMADNDPQAYRKFIDKHMKEGKDYMKPPEPHMCVQAYKVDSTKVHYINFCSWNRVPEPKTPEDAVPVTGTIFCQGRDEKGDFSYSGVAFNPKILDEFGINTKTPSDRDILINLAIDYILDQHKVRLSRSFTILPANTKYKGHLQTLQKAFTKQSQSSDQQFEDHLSEMEKTFGLQGSGAKDSLLNKLSNLSASESESSKSSSEAPNILFPNMGKENTNKSNLIQEVEKKVITPEYNMEEKYDGEELESLILTVHLPGVNKVSECELDISEDDVELKVTDRYHLNLSFPYIINDSEATAKFTKSTSSLCLWLPVQR